MLQYWSVYAGAKVWVNVNKIIKKKIKKYIGVFMLMPRCGSTAGTIPLVVEESGLIRWLFHLTFDIEPRIGNTER